VIPLQLLQERLRGHPLLGALQLVELLGSDVVLRGGGEGGPISLPSSASPGGASRAGTAFGPRGARGASGGGRQARRGRQAGRRGVWLPDSLPVKTAGRTSAVSSS
jgi:hypothetical protein